MLGGRLNYYQFDLKSKQSKVIIKAASEIICIKPFPEFHHEEYPFLLAKEENSICILNLKVNQRILLVDKKTNSAWEGCYDSMQFLQEDKEMAFVTRGNENEVLRYRISEELLTMFKGYSMVIKFADDM